MSQKASSITSLISAFARAYHVEHDEPLIFNDFAARELITSQELADIGKNMTQGIHFFTRMRIAHSEVNPIAC